LFIDDIDGGEADGTVRFGLDGTEYEIDLDAKHSGELHAALATYVAHARRAGSPAKRTVRGRRAAQAVDTGKVREWAKDKGYDIKERGRIPAEILAKYQAVAKA
jgi:sRNA-binding protein